MAHVPTVEINIPLPFLKEPLHIKATGTMAIAIVVGALAATTGIMLWLQ